MAHTPGVAQAVDCRDQKVGQIRLFVGHAHVANTRARGPNPADDARRFVAAWNDCTGIPTGSLEAGAVHEAREALEAAEKAFNTWLKATPIGDYYRAAEKVSAALRKLRSEAASA